jgi:hypothetical protein
MTRRWIWIAIGLVGAPLFGMLWQGELRATPQVTSKPQSDSSPIVFQFGGDAAEIPAEFIDNLVFLPVRINEGNPSLFELDSSAKSSSIDPTRATSLQLQTSQEAIADCFLNFTGVGMQIKSLPLIAQGDFSSQVGRVYEGTIGQDFLAHAVVQIDYVRKTLRIFDPGTFKNKDLGHSFPLTFAGGMPVVHAKFELLKGGDQEGDFAINTALDASVLVTDQSAERHHLFDSHGKGVRATLPEWDRNGEVALARSKSFRIGSFTVENALISFSSRDVSPVVGSKLVGEIGPGMLRHFTVVFDYPHRQMFLTPNSNFQNEDQEDKSGLALVASGPNLRNFEVQHVRAGSPADQAGIQKGDVIAGVDDDAAADLTLPELRDLFRQIGHQYKLLIQRNGQTISISLQMERQL